MTQITRKSVPARGMILLLAMFLGAGLVLSGCGDDSTPVTPAPAPAPPPPAPEPEPEPPAPEAPATPTGLAVSGQTETSVTYTWNEVEGAFGYEVQVSTDDEMFTDDDPIVIVFAPTYTVEPVAAGTSVYVRVRAGSTPTDPADPSSSVRSEWTTHVSGMAAVPDQPMPPMAPTGLMVSETGDDFIEWSWTAVEGADGYMVQFSTTDEGFTDTEAMVVADGATSYRAEELAPGTTAYLRVRAFTGEGDSRLMSNWSVHRTGTSNELPPPMAPTGLRVSDIGENHIEWTWDEVEGADGYMVQFSTTDEAFTDAEAMVVADGATSYRAEELAPGTTAYLRVRAFTGEGDSRLMSGWSVHRTGISTVPDQPMPPMAPTGLMVSDIGENHIEWTWDEVEGADGYMVQFSTTDEGFTDVEAMVVADGATSYRAEELAPGTTAYLRVRAFTGEGDSRLMSNWSVHRTGTSNELPPPMPPMAPTGLTVSDIGENHIEWSWDEVEGADGYMVQFSTTDEGFTDVEAMVVADGATSYRAEELAPGTTAYLRVLAFTGEGDSRLMSNWSVHRTGTSNELPPPMPPMAPTGLTVSDIGENHIQWSWDEVEDADGYMVQFSTTDEGFTDAEPMVVADGATSYRAEELAPGTTAYLRVLAFRGEGDSRLMSDWTRHRTGTSKELPPPTLPAPTGLTVSDKDLDFIAWTWDAVDGADGYLVQFSATDDFTDATAVLVSDGTSYRKGGLDPGTTGYLRVQAFMGENGSWLLSDWSTHVEGASDPLPAPLTPTGLTVTSGLGYIEWTWEAVENAGGYIVQFSMDEGFTDAEDVPVTDGTSYRAEGLDPGTTAYLRVRAFRDEGDARLTSDWTVHRTGTSDVPAAPTPPAAPTGLTVEVGDSDDDNTGHTTRWAWEEVEGADGYILQFSADETFTSEDTTMEISETEYSGVVAYGATRYVRVRAFTGEGDSRLMSDWTTHVTATAPAAPVAPTPVVVTFSPVDGDPTTDDYPMLPDDSTNEKTAMASVNPRLRVQSNTDAVIRPLFVEGASDVRITSGMNEPFTRVSWSALQSMVVNNGVTFRIQRVALGANQEMTPTSDIAYVTCGPFNCADGMEAPDITLADSDICENDQWVHELTLQIGKVDNDSGLVADGGLPDAGDNNGGDVNVRDGYDMGWVYSSSVDLKTTHTFGTFSEVEVLADKATVENTKAIKMKNTAIPNVLTVATGSATDSDLVVPCENDYGTGSLDIREPRDCFRLHVWENDYLEAYRVALEPPANPVSWGKNSWDVFDGFMCGGASYDVEADKIAGGDVCGLFRDEVTQAHPGNVTVTGHINTASGTRLVGLDLVLGTATSVTSDRYTALWYHDGAKSDSDRVAGDLRNLYDFVGDTATDRHIAGTITKRGNVADPATGRNRMMVWVPLVDADNDPVYDDLGKVDTLKPSGAPSVTDGGDDKADNFEAGDDAQACTADDGGSKQTTVGTQKQGNSTLCDSNVTFSTDVVFTDAMGGSAKDYAYECEVEKTYTITCDWDASGGKGAGRRLVDQTLSAANLSNFLSCTVSH